MFNAVNDGNPYIKLGASLAENFAIQSNYASGTQTLENVTFSTATSSGTADYGKFVFNVDGTDKFVINDNGANINGGDLAFTVIDTNASASSSAGGRIRLVSNDGATMGSGHRLGVLEFQGAEDGSSTITTGARIEAITDAAWSASENGASLKFYTTDGNASESLVLTLDSNKLSTFSGAIRVNGATGISIIDATTSGGSEGGNLVLASDDGAVLAQNHRLGVVEFKGAMDTSNTLSTGARIEAIAEENFGEEEASTSLKFYTTDGPDQDLALTLDSDNLATFAGGVTVSGDLTGADATFTSSTTEKPIVTIKNTNSDTKASTLKFVKDKGAAGADGDHVGTIDFIGDDAAQAQTTFARIRAKVSEADNTDEAGQLILSVAESDGTTTALSPGLILEGEHATDREVDVTIANGSASLTTISGDLSITTGLILDSVDVTAIQTSGESFADNDTSLMTSAAIDDAILKGGSITTIKVLPTQFMMNEDGGVNKSIQYDDTGTLGVRASSADGELYAFVEIPTGKTATSVTVYGNDTGNVVNVYEADINASGIADKTPGGGCVVGSACDITDVAADATNYLAIKVTVTATSDIVYGAAVTISG